MLCTFIQDFDWWKIFRYLKHVVEQIEFDNGLRLYQVVNHRCVNLTNGISADSNDKSF